MLKLFWIKLFDIKFMAKALWEKESWKIKLMIYIQVILEIPVGDGETHRPYTTEKTFVELEKEPVSVPEKGVDCGGVFRRLKVSGYG